MNTETIRHGRCSFTMPQGYHLEEEGSPLIDSAAYREHAGKGPPVNLSLSKPGTQPAGTSEAYQEGKPDPAAFAVTLSLYSRPAKFTPQPMDILHEENQALGKELADYNVDFTRDDSINGVPAATGQSSFMTNLRLFKLTLAWTMDSERLIAGTMVPEELLDESWQALRQLAESVKLADAIAPEDTPCKREE